MRIPDKLKVGGFEWEVVKGNESLHEATNSYGHTSPRNLKISLSQEEKSDKQQEAFIHELLHACLWNCAFDDILYRYDKSLEEDLVSALGRALFQVIKDNHLFE